MTLTVADIERWNAGDVREVFHAATSRAQAAFDAADGLANLPAFTSWGGESAEAAKAAIGLTRKDLDSHGNEALAVASAARGAADNIERIKSELASLKADAEALGMEIDPVSGTVVPGPKIRNPMEAELKQAQLQPRLTKIVAEANLVDMALANAINMAGGKTPIPSPLAGNAPGGQPTNVDGALDQIAGAPVPANAPRPVVFSAKEIEDFKTSARPILQAEGMPPEQIEPYLSGMVARAQAMGANFPKYTPRGPARMPPPGFGEGFGDAWRNTEQGIKNLLGQGARGSRGSGFLERCGHGDFRHHDQSGGHGRR